MSSAELFDAAYRSIWMALHRPDDPDLSQHERDILSHIPREGCSLGTIVQHLGLPKSTCSEIVKSLGQRGFLLRVRDSADERRIHLSLTAKGRERVHDDRVLDQDGLSRALALLPDRDRATLLRLMQDLGDLARRGRAVQPRAATRASGDSHRRRSAPPAARTARSGSG